MKYYLRTFCIIRKHQSGFTLVEILLVMLLISILILGINAAYSQAHRFWSRINASQPIYAQTRVALDTLRDELSAIYLPTAQAKEGQESPVYFYVKTVPGQSTELSFLTLGPSWNANPTISKPAKVTYTFKKEADEATLVRLEQYFSGEIPIEAESQSQVILKGLNDLKFFVMERDSEDNSWKDNFESSDKPPQSVKFQITWPEDKYRDTIQMETIIPILCNNNTTPKQ